MFFLEDISGTLVPGLLNMGTVGMSIGGDMSPGMTGGGPIGMLNMDCCPCDP